MTQDQVKFVTEPVNGEYPFEVLLLSGRPLQTNDLGRFVVDLTTLSRHKDRLIVDYNHDEYKILGFADRFDITDDGLMIGGKLISDEEVRKNEKGEVIERIPGFVDRLVKLSVHETPFEASATVTERDGDVVFLRKGESATVNGREVQGPLTIFKNVPLRGIAICPHGTDRFTHFTVLKEQFETMKKNTTPNVTKLSEEGTGDAPKVKDPDLAEFVEIYGSTKGLELWQSGADINDIRTMRELIDKYGLPDPPADEPTELSATEEEEKKDDESTPEPKKDDEEKTNLKAEVSVLKKAVTGLTAEMTRLRAVLPRGEKEGVSHGIQEETPPKKTPRPGVYGMADKIASQIG